MLILKKIPLNELEREWREIESNNKSISPFQYYKFIKIVNCHYLFFKLAKMEFPIFFKIIEDDATIMIVPLCKRITKEGTYYTSFGTTPTIAYQDLIFDKSMTIEKMVECLEFINKKLKKVKFHNIPESSLTFSAFRYLGIKPLKEHVNISIPVAETHEVYIQRLSKSTRQNIRTAYNRLKKDGLEYDIRVINGAELTRQEVKKIMDLYIRRRRIRYRSTSKLHEWFLRHEHFNTIALSKLDNGIYMILYINGRLAGFWGGYISTDDKIVTVPRLAIDDTFKRYSPGIILINETMKWFCAVNRRQFDLSKGDDSYKLTMGGEKYLSYDFVLEEI